MSALLLVLALTAPVDSAAHLTLLYGAPALADLATTEWVLRNGGTERNPFLQERPVRLAVNAAVVAAEVWGTRKLQRTGHPRAARVVKVGSFVVRGFAVAWNIRQARRGR